MHSGSRSIPGAAVAAALAGAFIASACAPARPVNPGAVRADARTSHRVQASLLADPLIGAIAIGVDLVVDRLVVDSEGTPS